MTRSILLTPEAAEDLRFWRAVDERISRRIDALLMAALRDPAAGAGRPVRLREFDDLGFTMWSRAIDGPHRLVYEQTGNGLVVHQCRYAY